MCGCLARRLWRGAKRVLPEKLLVGVIGTFLDSVMVSQVYT